MVIEERIGADKVQHYSSNGKLILQSITGALFEIAVDVYPCPYEYTEYNGETPQEEVDDTEALNIILGVEE